MSQPKNHTAERLLDSAEAVVQLAGFNGFSFADLASAVGIAKPSIHHHFRTKAELGRRLIVRYNERFAAACDAIYQSTIGTRAALTKYADLYEQVLRNQRMCLCGILAAEYSALPEKMQRELLLFVRLNEVWIAKVINRGKEANEVFAADDSDELAKYIIGSLEGAMLMARVTLDLQRFRSASERLIESVCKVSR